MVSRHFEWCDAGPDSPRVRQRSGEKVGFLTSCQDAEARRFDYWLSEATQSETGSSSADPRPMVQTMATEPRNSRIQSG